MVKENTDKDDGIGECPLTSELSENKLRHNFRLGDITWVKHSDSSWWPAQVIDEACVSGKPKKKAKHDVLVRLYGTCQYLYVDPWKSNAEFKMMLKQENKSAMETFHEVIEKELSHVKSPCDYDEEAVYTKGKTSSRKVRKREGLKRSGRRGVKESATTEGLGDKTEQRCGAEQDQEIRNLVRDTLFSDVIARQRAAEMAYVDDVIKGICDATEENMTGGATAATKGGRGIKRNGSRAEAESCNGTQRLRKVDKVTRSQNEATEDPMQVTNPETMSYHITKNNNSKGNDSNSLEGIIDTTPSRDAATAELGQLSARQIRIMQSLALIAPSGSPFGRNGLVATTHRQF